MNEHVQKGYSGKLGQLFDIPFTEFPCLVVFHDIRSPEHVVVTLKDMEADGIAAKMRLVFTIIQKAVSDKKNPLAALASYQNQESLHKTGQSVIGEIRSFSEKTLETLMEAWIKAIIK